MAAPVKMGSSRFRGSRLQHVYSPLAWGLLVAFMLRRLFAAARNPFLVRALLSFASYSLWQPVGDLRQGRFTGCIGAATGDSRIFSSSTSGRQTTSRLAFRP
jgi:hypothetical protein